MHAHLHQLATRSAAAQAGVLSRRQLFALGFTDSTIRSYVRNHRFDQLARGVYNTVTGMPNLSALRWAAHLRCGPESFLFGTSALEFWGYEESTTARSKNGVSDVDLRECTLLEMAIPSQVHLKVSEPWIRPVRVSANRTVETVAELPIESRGDALIDATKHMRSDEEVQNFVASVVQSRVVRAEELQKAAQGRQFPYRSTIDSTIDLLRGGQTSPLEIKGKQNILDAHGLPQGIWQQPMTLDGVYMVVDLYFPDQQVIVEFDGFLFHNDSYSKVQDRTRDNAAIANGISTVRFGWNDVTRRPCSAGRELARVLSGRGWNGVPTHCRRKKCNVLAGL